MVTLDHLRTGTRRAWQRLYRRLGWPGLLGGLLAAAAMVLALAGRSLQHDSDDAVAQLEQQGAALRRLHATRAGAGAAVIPGDLTLDALPSFHRNGEDLKQLFASAREAHVNLPKGDYALKSEPGSPLITYTATFAVREPYAVLKAFAASLLQEIPHAALEELRMSRNESTATVLDASLRITLVYRRP